MATRNKSIEINIESYRDSMKNNKEPEDMNMKRFDLPADDNSEKQPTDAARTEVARQTETEEKNIPSKKNAVENKPKKTVSRMREKFLKREFRQYVPFDDQSQMQLSSIKALARIGMKDFIFFATVQELERRFPDGTITPEGIEKLKKDFKKLFGE